MSSSRRLRCVAALFAGLFVALVAHAAPPTTMFHARFQLVAFGIAPDSFEAKPREVWRAGFSHLRFEPAIHPDTRSATFAAATMPDVWQWDIATKRGTHVRDTGDAPRVRFPVFVSETDPAIAELEMGREREWFAAQQAQSIGDRTVGDVACTASEVKLGERELTLYVRKDNGLPYQVALFDGKRVYAVRFLVYEPAVAFDPARFVAPKDVVFEER
jgi:hypothetical protein